MLQINITMPSAKSDSGSWQGYALDWDSRQRITLTPSFLVIPFLRTQRGFCCSPRQHYPLIRQRYPLSHMTRKLVPGVPGFASTRFRARFSSTSARVLQDRIVELTFATREGLFSWPRRKSQNLPFLKRQFGGCGVSTSRTVATNVRAAWSASTAS